MDDQLVTVNWTAQCIWAGEDLTPPLFFTKPPGIIESHPTATSRYVVTKVNELDARNGLATLLVTSPHLAGSLVALYIENLTVNKWPLRRV